MEESIKRTDLQQLSLVKTLKMLLFVRAAEFLISVVLSYLVKGSNTTALVNAGLSYFLELCSLVCIFSLRRDNRYYLPAGVFMAIKFGFTLVIQLFGWFVAPHIGSTDSGMQLLLTLTRVNGILNGCVLILSVLGTLFEMWGHSALAAPRDPRLAKHWKALFFWYIGLTVCASGCSYLISSLFAAGHIGPEMINGANIVLQLPVKIIAALSLYFLYRTVKLFKRNEEINDGI